MTVGFTDAGRTHSRRAWGCPACLDGKGQMFWNNAQKMACNKCSKKPNPRCKLYGTDGTDGGKWSPFVGGPAADPAPSVRTPAMQKQHKDQLQKAKDDLKKKDDQIKKLKEDAKKKPAPKSKAKSKAAPGADDDAMDGDDGDDDTTADADGIKDEIKELQAQLSAAEKLYKQHPQIAEMLAARDRLKGEVEAKQAQLRDTRKPEDRLHWIGGAIERAKTAANKHLEQLCGIIKERGPRCTRSREERAPQAREAKSGAAQS